MPSAADAKAALDAASGEALEQPPIVKIEAERLYLETLTMDALDEIMPILTTLDVMKWTSRPPVKNKDEGRSWLATRCLGKDVFNFAIRLRPSLPDSPGALIGLLGSFHWPACGYMIHPSHAGHGYATEALRAFIPAYFARVPRAGSSTGEDGSASTGHDVLEGYADTQNGASHRVLEKCGFVRCETTVGDFENPILGVRDTVAFRFARPGTTLAELGLDPKAEEPKAPEPPVQ